VAARLKRTFRRFCRSPIPPESSGSRPIVHRRAIKPTMCASMVRFNTTTHLTLSSPSSSPGFVHEMPRPLDVDSPPERPTLTLNTRAAEVARRLAELEADPKCRSPGPLLILQQPSLHDPSEVTIKTALFHGQLVPVTIQPSLVPSPRDPNRPARPPMRLPPVGQYTHGWPLQAIQVTPASPSRQMRRINLYLNVSATAMRD
jgi:hypothetical protein